MSHLVTKRVDQVGVLVKHQKGEIMQRVSPTFFITFVIISAGISLLELSLGITVAMATYSNGNEYSKQILVFAWNADSDHRNTPK